MKPLEEDAAEGSGPEEGGPGAELPDMTRMGRSCQLPPPRSRHVCGELACKGFPLGHPAYLSPRPRSHDQHRGFCGVGDILEKAQNGDDFSLSYSRHHLQIPVGN